MKTATTQTRKHLPALLRPAVMAVGLASLVTVAGCASQPSPDDVSYHYVTPDSQFVSFDEECRMDWIMVCKTGPEGNLVGDPQSSCECQPIDRFERSPERDRLSKWHGQQRRF